VTTWLKEHKTPLTMLLVAYLLCVWQWRSHVDTQLACMQTVTPYAPFLGHNGVTLLQVQAKLIESRGSFNPMVWAETNAETSNFCAIMSH